MTVSNGEALLRKLPPDQAALAAQLPAKVRAEYVATPFGPRHPSCVRHVDESDSVDDEGILHADGTREHLAPCAYPAFGGRPAAPAITAAPNNTGNDLDDGWQAASWWSKGTTNIVALASDYAVPLDPPTYHGQTVFLFTSLEDPSEQYIVQPVLQWGPSAAGGGAYWAMAGWVVGPNNYLFISSLLQTGYGHTMRGLISGSNCANNHCVNFAVSMTDLSNNHVSTLHYVNSRALTFNNVQGGVLEAYGLTNCGDLPRTLAAFEDVHARVYGNALQAPVWNNILFTTQCRLSVVSSTYATHIHENSD